MANYDVSIDKPLLAGLLSNQSGLAELVTTLLNQVLQAQMAEHLNAAKHERSNERIGFRNGTRERIVKTRVGSLTLQVPQTRDGSFDTGIFKRFQRNEQALVLAMMEMYVQGVSTRKVTAITEELCGTSFSKSTISNLCADLDERVEAFRGRSFTETYPVLIVDAMYLKARVNDRIVSRAVFITSGIRCDGYREVLSVDVDNSESLVTWKAVFSGLKARGLKGVELVISDAHEGIIEGVKQAFTGASWQRCQVHLMRNIVAHAAPKLKQAISEAASLVFNASDMVDARRQLKLFCEAFEATAAKSVECMENGFDDAMTVMCFPLKYRKKFRTSNMQERLNEEVRRREKVVRIFPNDIALLRLVGSVLVDKNDHWSERLYLDMGEFNEWIDLQKRKPEVNI